MLIFLSSCMYNTKIALLEQYVELDIVEYNDVDPGLENCTFSL